MFNVAGGLEPSPLEPDIDIVIPVGAWTGGIDSPVVIGAFAGLLPAVRASRLAPTVALRTA